MRPVPIHFYRYAIWLLVLIIIILPGCGGQAPYFGSRFFFPGPTHTATFAPFHESEIAPAGDPAATRTPTTTSSPTAPPSPTITLFPTITLTPTFDFPEVRVLMQANCRYGPGKAYLYSHGLYKDDQAEVHGRNYSGSWLWIKPENLDRHCWVSTSVVEVNGEIFTVVIAQTKLPHSTLYGPPEYVEAGRDGDRVVVSWEPVWMTEDDFRGYLIEATICQNGQMTPIAIQTDETSYEFTDEQNCPEASSGKLYTVEKHGYTDPVEIPWP